MPLIRNAISPNPDEPEPKTKAMSGQSLQHALHGAQPAVFIGTLRGGKGEGGRRLYFLK